MARLMFLIAVIIGGLIIIKLGVDEVRQGSLRENLLHTLLDIIINAGTTSGFGTIALGIVLTLIAILALIFGWGT